VPGDLHARFSAISRTYRYYVHTLKDPFLNENSWFVHDVPDVALMNDGADLLLGYEDFTSFSKLHTDVKSNICHLEEARWDETGHRLVFAITADRFLRNMVRAIVGTLMDLGQGKISMAQLKGIIEVKNRSEAGQSVPAHALFLEKVIYPVKLD
jgi:tRNA pseudouridine38-40 synthase